MNTLLVCRSVDVTSGVVASIFEIPSSQLMTVHQYIHKNTEEQNLIYVFQMPVVDLHHFQIYKEQEDLHLQFSIHSDLVNIGIICFIGRCTKVH